MNTNDLDVIYLSPIRWESGEQRPQQLLRRAARNRRVFFVEAPRTSPEPSQLLIAKDQKSMVWKVTPLLSESLSHSEQNHTFTVLLEELLRIHEIRRYLLWYSNAQFLDVTRRLRPEIILYDTLIPSKNADSRLSQQESELLHIADVVITEGQQVSQRQSIFSAGLDYFPASLDINHFRESRLITKEPIDQAKIPHPRLGFFGVINHLFDVRLVQKLADLRPDWQLIFIGPISINPDPWFDRPNIHYLSTRSYESLPAYLAGWDAAILPVVQRRDLTSVSGYQVPQYLSGGCPVVASPVPELVQNYGRREVIWFARTAEQFVQAVETGIARKRNTREWLADVDQVLLESTWDMTWAGVQRAIETCPPKQSSPFRSEDVPAYLPDQLSLLVQ